MNDAHAATRRPSSVVPALDGFTWTVEATPREWVRDGWLLTRAQAPKVAWQWLWAAASCAVLCALGLLDLLLFPMLLVLSGLFWAMNLLVYRGRGPRVIRLHGRRLQVLQGDVPLAEANLAAVAVHGQQLIVGDVAYAIHDELGWLEAHLASLVEVPEGSASEVPEALRKRPVTV